MLIEKINTNQIKIILDLEDLRKNNISLHSFMCNSKESQNLFLNILDFANKNNELNFKNHEFNMESFFIPSMNSFIMLITYISKKMYVYPSKKTFNTFKFNKSFWLEFNCLKNFCMFCNFLNSNYKIHSSLYVLNSSYFLYINSNNIQDYFRILTIAKEFANTTYNNTFFLNENADIIINNSAIETCKKYFI